MNWLKKGPELKLPKLKRPSLGSGSGRGLKMPRLGGSRGPDLKPPAFLADLYYDLRDRRLLLPIALVLVAIVAVPFLMGSDPEPLPPVSEAAPEAVTAKASKLTVVEATPGLRDYRKRLSGRSASDPFVQQYTESASAGGGSEGGSGSSSASSSTGSSAASAPAETGSGPSSDGGATAPGSETGGSGSGNGGGGGSADTPPADSRFYAYRPNVRFGVAGSENLAVHEHLSLGSLLPKKNPIAVFIGSSEKGERVAFSLSRDVIEVRGPGTCSGGKDDCSLLFLRAGQAVDLVTEAGQTFRLHVVQIDFVQVEKPAPTPAGSSSAAGERRNGFESLQSFIK